MELDEYITEKIINKTKENPKIIRQLIPYIHEEHTPPQIRQILKGIENNLTKKEILKFSSAKYDSEQMRIIRTAIKERMTAKEIEIFDSPKINYRIMKAIKTIIQNNISIKELKEYDICNIIQKTRNRKYENNRIEETIEEIKLIEKMIKNNIPKTDINYIHSDKFHLYQKKEITKGIISNLTKQQIQYIKNPNMPAYNIKTTIMLFKNKIPQNIIDSINKKEIQNNTNHYSEYEISHEEVIEWTQQRLTEKEINTIIQCNSLTGRDMIKNLILRKASKQKIEILINEYKGIENYRYEKAKKCVEIYKDIINKKSIKYIKDKINKSKKGE